MIIENVDWQINSLCNRCCKYCFGPKNYQEIDFESFKLIVSKMSENGLKQIDLTGGEPLLHSEFDNIVRFLYNKNISIYLSTNCDYYSQHSEIIKDYISIVGIPIDGSHKEIHDLTRGEGSFYSVQNTLNDIIQSTNNIKIKIGTVVTNKNLSDLKRIEMFLEPYKNKILYWKLYELIAYDRNRNDVQELMPAGEWNYVAERLGDLIGKDKVIVDTKFKRSNSYFFLKPNADVFVPVLGNSISYEKTIGNMLNDEYSKIINNFEKLVDIQGFNAYFRYMKP